MDKYAIKVVNKDYRPTQEEMKDFADKWIKRQLYWIPGKKEEKDIEKSAVEFFRSYREVDRIIWADSYMDKKHLTDIGSAAKPAVGDVVWSAVWSSVGGAVWSVVWSDVGDAVRSAVWSAVGDVVWSAVWSSVGGAVWSAVWSDVGGAVWSAVGDAVGSLYYSHIMAPYSYLDRIVRNPYKKFSISVLGTGGMGFIDNDLYLFRKPIIKMKDGRLHNDKDMAIKWPDGNGFYFIDGVRVNEKIAVRPEDLIRKDWQDEENLEVRRIIQERMPNFVEKIGGKEIDSVRGYTLYEIDITPDPEKIAKYLKMKDTSTDRIYYLRVPPSIDYAPDALAWTYNMTKEEYQPIKES